MPSLAEIKKILADPNPQATEELARQAAAITRQYFGRTISLYAPLYLSNYCSSHCTYCGFHSHNRIRRIKLTFPQMEAEMQKLASLRLENVLLLTGESPTVTPLNYLIQSVHLAKKYFASISLEIFPLETAEYCQLFKEGVDGITVYQETYDRKRYSEVHLAGRKKNYDYRYQAPERIAQAGIRQLSMGILLGLGNASCDLFALFEHLQFMEKHYPGVEYSLSFPRLRSIKGKDFSQHFVDDITFIKCICLTRLAFPRVGINLSTRETAFLRDHALGLGITRISAGSSTAVGGYNILSADDQDPQFDIHDTRSVKEILQTLKTKNFDPVLTDWRAIKNP